MKKIDFLVVVLLLASCNSSNKHPETVVANPMPDTATVVRETIDTVQVDGMTSATAIANPASFNGTLVIPPRNFATVALSIVAINIGGIVKDLALLPGTYVCKGTVLGTLENPDFIDLQQAYLDSQAQLEYLEAEYRRQQNLSRQEAASQKKLRIRAACKLRLRSCACWEWSRRNCLPAVSVRTLR